MGILLIEMIMLFAQKIISCAYITAFHVQKFRVVQVIESAISISREFPTAI